MRIDRLSLSTAAFAAAMLSAVSAQADNSALGVWIDHTGRGAVEITDCGGKLCGHVAWVKDAEHSSECGKKIIGNVKSVGKNKWDNGWIFDPDRDSKYDVELTLLNDDKLKVMGYAGSKWFSESYTWKRAPADLQKCNGDSAAKTTPAPAATTAKSEAKSDAKTESEPAKAETKSDTIELKAAKTENDDADSAKSDVPAKADKPAARETAKTGPAKSEAKASDETADAEPEDDANADEPKGKKQGAGKVIARLMDELGDGDGPIKVKRTGKTCKITAPYVGVISIPCDRD